jgi:ribose/xylose/arabinose/galactoside ABC-type transport system permease subunit
MLALLLVTMIAFGLQLAGVNATYQLALLGVLLLVTVTLNQFILRQSSRAKA